MNNKLNGNRIKFIDIFAGIGGMRLGLERAGMECVGYIEIDKFARASYEAMHDTAGEWTARDIKQVKPEDVPPAGLWAFGFPCQGISVAGLQKGLKDERSSMFYEVIRLLKGKSPEDRPEWLLCENVKNLLSIDGGGAFTEVLAEISEAGYDAEWHLVNSKDHGVPQNRERVFIVGHLRARGSRRVFPEPGESGSPAGDSGIKAIAHGGHQQNTIYKTDGIARTITSAEGGGIGGGVRTGLYAVPCITPDRMKKRQNGRRFKEPNDPMFTLTAQDKHGVLIYDGDEYCIRKLTPKECFRLQGFPDELFEKAEKECSNSQLYKQAGNAVTVPVAEFLGKLILEAAE